MELAAMWWPEDKRGGGKEKQSEEGRLWGSNGEEFVL